MRKVTRSVWWVTALVAVAAGCHREEQDAPLFERKIPLGALNREWALASGHAGR